MTRKPGTATVVAALVVGALAIVYASTAVNRGDGVDDGLDRSARPSTTTVTVTVPKPATVTVTEPPPAPRIAFADGLYLVGKDVQPGNYRSDRPTATVCYWARLTDASGTDIIANDVTDGPTRVTVVAGEYLEVSGCSFYAA